MKQEVNINQIKPNKDNPRIIKDYKFKKLVESLKSFPRMLELRPIVVDDQMIILGGNMRYRAAMEAGLDKIWIEVANGLTDKEKKEFIIKDNSSFGEWDWDILGNEWDENDLVEWGLDIPEEWALNPDDLSDDFSLADGDRDPFESLTFKLADEQAIKVRDVIDEIKSMKEINEIETFGNDNKTGNALYLLVSKWEELKK